MVRWFVLDKLYNLYHMVQYPMCHSSWLQ